MNKTIVITGASDGIGACAAGQLKALGHNVIIVGRNAEKTRKTASELDVPYHIADYAKLCDVARLARELSAYPRIDVLVNNAGAMQNGRVLTQDGFERTFQVNVLAGFLLTKLLLEKLCADRATVITTSSVGANLFGRKFDIDDLQNEKEYSPIRAYSEAKLCGILLTRELDRRYGHDGVSAVAFEPGIPRSNFASEAPFIYRFAYHSPLKYLFTTSAKSGARCMVNLALAEAGADFLCGLTYSGNKPMKVKFRDDGSIAEALWEKCEQICAEYSSSPR